MSNEHHHHDHDQPAGPPAAPAHQPDAPWAPPPSLGALTEAIHFLACEIREAGGGSTAEEAISLLTRELREDREQRKIEFEWHKSHSNLATKQDLEGMEKRIMAKLEDLCTAATALSTASDSLSVKVDDLVTKVDKALTLIGTTDLPDNAVAALEALKKSRDTVVAQGDRVDSEVLKLDAILPTPAPAGTPV